MSIKLNRENLKTLPDNVKGPGYSQQALSAGIVHIGVGNFHRAHQAMYLHRLFNTGEGHDWAIRGAGVTSYDGAMREKLKPQDWLTTVVELDTNGLSAHICASMIDFIDNDAASLIDALTVQDIRIVSLTITEGGYYIDEKTGGFSLNHPDIQHDINDFKNPSTVFGIILRALSHRRDKGMTPFTVMSCDNIPHNGDVTARTITELAYAIDEGLAAWITKNVSFPNSMVDCITPATSKRELDKLTEMFGIEDSAPVFCEPYRQWVMEDKFINGRPPLEKVGVEFVDDVAPYELMKLRILNGGHAAIAYPAALLGITYVHEVIENDLIRPYLRKLTEKEIIPTLEAVPGVNLRDYAALIESRFANPEVKDTVSRLCQDASNRLPKFIMPIIRSNIQHNRSCKGLALVIALWCRLCAASADPKSGVELQDQHADILKQKALLAKNVPNEFLQINDIFGEIGKDATFRKHFSTWLAMLWDNGTSDTLKHFITMNDA